MDELSDQNLSPDMTGKLVRLNADGVLVVSDSGEVLFANPAAADLLNRPREELVGHVFGFPIGGDEPGEIEILCGEGERSVLEMRVSEAQWSGEPAHIVSLRDVTEREEAKRRAQYLNEFLLSSNEFNRHVVEQSNPADVLESACNTLHDVRYHRHVWAATFGEKDDLQFVAQSGVGDGIEQLVSRLRNGELPDCVENALEDPGFARKSAGDDRCNDCPLATDEAEHLVLQYGFEATETCRGIVSLCMESEHPFVDEEVQLLARVAEDIGHSLRHQQNLRLRREAEAEREKALEEARSAKERYRQLFENSADALFIHDFEGNHLEVNEEACRRLGYSRDELLNMNVRDHDGPAAPDAEARMQEIRRNGEALFEGQHVTEDGKKIPVEIHSRMIEYEGRPAILSAARDITQRRRAWKEAEKLLTAVKAAQEAIIVASAAGDITFVNEAACKLFGYEAGELMDGHPMMLIPEEGSGHDLESIMNPVRESGSWEGELETETKSGERLTCHATITAVRNDSGEISNYIATANDISDRKRAEQRLRETLDELKRTQRQVVDQERQRALNQMASGIAHDFNNALSTIRGFTELLLEDPERRGSEETVCTYLELIDSAASNAAETVRRMRKFYRPREETEMGSVDLNSVAEEAISLTRPRWHQEAQAEGRSIEINPELDELPPVLGNESELHEMLSNFIFNAVDAMEEDGEIRIVTRAGEEEVILEVSDTGPGMDEYTRRHCLDPFFTTKGESGSGLGLSTTVGIVNRHEGNISVESEPGEGTTFRVTLPLAQGEVRGEEEPEEAREEKSLQILVAEDDESQRNLVGEMLESMGHIPELTSNGEEALQEFDNGWYHLVLTDRAMPAIRGDELARLIRERAPDKPVVMLTGFGDMMEAAKEEPENVDVVISKPVSLKKLREAINQSVFERTEPDREAEERPEDENEPVEVSGLGPLLRDMAERLDRNDPESDELIPGLEDALAGTALESRVKELNDHLSVFDFSAARGVLREMADLAGVDPGEEG